jgi:serine/threonine protein kinase
MLRKTNQLNNKYSSLPYEPQFLRAKDIYAAGHPAFVNELHRIFPLVDNCSALQKTVYKERPNLIHKTSLLPEMTTPWLNQVVKQYKWRGRHQLFFSIFSQSKALKSFHAACHLIRHGLSTPLPLLAAERRQCGFIRENIYVTELIDNHTTVLDYLNLIPDSQEEVEDIVRLLADYILKMHDSGFLHRDLNSTNFLLTGSPGKRKLYLVDLNRARRAHHLSFKVRALELSRLKLKRWQPLFFRHYCHGRFDHKVMLEIAKAAKLRRKAWRKKTRKFYLGFGNGA